MANYTSSTAAPTDINIPALLKKLTGDYETAQAEQQRRFTAGMSDLSDVVNMYSGDVSGKVSKTAMTAAKGSMAGLGGKMPTKLSKTFQSAIKRMSTAGKTKALGTRAAFQNAFPNLFPGPSALVNLATGGFGGLTRQFQAESLGGPLNDPFATLQSISNRSMPYRTDANYNR